MNPFRASRGGPTNQLFTPENRFAIPWAPQTAPKRLYRVSRAIFAPIFTRFHALLMLHRAISKPTLPQFSPDFMLCYCFTKRFQCRLRLNFHQISYLATASSGDFKADIGANFMISSWFFHQCFPPFYHSSYISNPKNVVPK